MPFRVWRVMGRSAVVCWRNLPLLLTLTAIVSLPRIAWSVYRMFVPWDGGMLDGEPDQLEFWLNWIFSSFFGLAVLNLVFVQLTVAVVALAVYRALRGETGTVMESLRGGLRRWLPVTGVALVITAIQVAVGVGYSFAMFELVPAEEYQFEVLYHGSVLVSLIALTPFCVAVPAAVVERKGSYLVRSWRLTSGRASRVFSVLVLIHLVSWGSSGLLETVRGDLSLATQTAMDWALELTLIAWIAVLAAVTYHALRLEKEGVDVATLDEVFA